MKITAIKCFAILSFACCIQNGFAQSLNDGADTMIDSLAPPSKYFILPAHTSFKNVSWRDSIYRFPSFDFGRVTFATGYSPQEKMRFNYNLYFAQMDYIDANGDTLQVKPSRELKLIEVNGHLFYHDYKVGYIEVILQLPVALGGRDVLMAELRRNGDLVDLRGAPADFPRYYRKYRSFYFISKDNKLYKSNRTNIIKLFYDNKKQVANYVDENNVDFESEDDLVKLVNYCNRLTPKNSE